MPDERPGGEPEYKVYRSRPGLFDRLRPRRPESPLGGLRRGGRGGRPPGQPSTLRRVVKWVLLAALGWILLSIVLFFVSAQTNEGVSEEAKDALSSEGTLLTGSTVLVIGSDARSEETDEPGSGGPGRADTLLLLHVGIGTVNRLSIPRDSLAEIPGHATQKINAAYAFGGPSLTIRTVESFLGNGLNVNHVIEVSFVDFPKLIDALGGIDVKLEKCIRSSSFGGRRVRLKRGEHHLDGDEALAFARVRKNSCAPDEDDRARARRQQQVLSAMRSQVVSPLNWPGNFVRAPLIAWRAPRTIRSDMKGPGMAALFTDLLTGGGGKTRVLVPCGVGAGDTLLVCDDEKERAVEQLTGD